MDPRRLVAATCAGVLVTVGLLPLPVLAAGPDRAPTRVNVGRVDPSFMPPAADPGRIVTVMLQLRGSPAVRSNVSRLGQRSAARDLDWAQQQVASEVARAGGRVVASYRYTYNGLRVRTRAGNVDELAALPDVVAVRPLRTYDLGNANGNAAIGASAAWAESGATGDGAVVAVIDTGIDYTHADFGGEGTAAAYEANDPGTVEAASFPTAKVIAGHDFAGDDYDASGNSGSRIPLEDEDPLDCNGHGSHVAGTVAGAGVSLDGSAYGGPYTAAAVGDGSDFRVAPGIAPEAALVALKVFGCQGSTDLVVDALEWVGAYNAHHVAGIDVVNLSLGSPFGAPTDPDAVAANALVSSGVVVVAAAGNDGDVPYITGTPAAATKGISVAAYDALPDIPMATIGTADGDIRAVNMNGSTGLPVSGPLEILLSGTSGLSPGCDLDRYAGVSEGDIVVVKRGDCSFADKGGLAQAAGAAAIIVVNRDDGGVRHDELPPYVGGDPASFAIPMLGTANNVAGSAPVESLDDVLMALDGTDVTLTDAPSAANPDHGRIADFSSTGPRWGDSALKADVAAPGVSVLSVAMGSGADGTTFSGTSMAAPMTAGAAALVIQTHRAWTPLQVKASLANTADASAVVGYSPLRAGSGLIQADRAVSANVLATTSDGTAALSWGYRQLAKAWTSSRYITITNDGPSSATYSLSSPTSRVKLSAATVAIPSHAAVKIKVTASLSRKAVRRLCSADQWVGEGCDGLYTLTGAIIATPVNARSGQHRLRVPYIIAPRGVSRIASSRSSPWTKSGRTISGRLLFGNRSYHDGYVDVYALGRTDAKGDGANGTDLRATGVQVLSPSFLDYGSDPADRSLLFAVNVHDRFSSASPHEFDVLIDVDGDRSADFELQGFDYGLAAAGAYYGLFATFIRDVAADEYLDWAYFADAPLNGSTLLLPALASDFGLIGRGSFAYKVVAHDGLTGHKDWTGWSRTVNPWRMKQSNGQFKPVAGKDTARTRAWFRRVSSVRGWLVVSMDDRNGAAQADVVSLPRKP